MKKERALKDQMLTSHTSQSPLKKKGFDFDLQAQFEAKGEKIANELKSYGMQGHTPTRRRSNRLATTVDRIEGQNTLNAIQSKRNSRVPTSVDANEGQSTLNATLSKCSQKQGRDKTMQDQALESRKRKNLIPTTMDANEGTSRLNSIALESRKRKNPIPTTSDANEGTSRLNSIQANCTQKHVLNILPPMRKTMIQSSQRKDQNNLLMLGTVLQDEDQLDILELQNLKSAKKKAIYPSMTVDQFLEKQGIHVEIDEESNIDPGNMTSDDDFADLEVGEDNFVGDQVMATNCDEGGIPKKRKTRGRTTCKSIHARTWEEREEVIFDKGQPVGPTDKRVSDLTNFLGTMARDRRFVNLLYTNWHAVPEKNINSMWEYVKSKFILPNDAKKWVMTTIREAWRRYKGKIKKKHFDKYDTVEDMLKNRPVEVPETQFSKLIKYWNLPTVQSVCYKNSQSRKKQKYGHRMGPINFARVRMALRTTKGTNEDPTKSEIFVATRTSRKGKEVDYETQAAILEFQNRQDAGEMEEDAFEAVFGKEQPGRVRCYGRSITATYLKKDAEISQIRQQHNEEVTSLKSDIGDLKGVIHGLQHAVKVLLQRCDTGMSAGEVEALMQFAQRSRSGVAGPCNPHSSGSTQVPNQEMVDSDDASGDDNGGL